MRILVTGASGLLGRKVLAALRRQQGWEPIATARAPGSLPRDEVGTVYPLDVCDRDQVRAALTRTRPAAVIHTAAMTDVDGCEREPERAWAVNVGGTQIVAEACARVSARLVHLSTEYVFDGRAGPYRESDAPNPLSVYGRTKLESERAVAASCERWAVARTTVLFGYAPGVRANFVLWLLGRLARGERTRVVADQIGSPTLADNLADMVLALAGDGGHGIYHTVGGSRLARSDFARLAATEFGLDADLIDPVATADLCQPAPRPLAAGLSTARFQREFPTVPVLSARDALERLRRQLAAAGKEPVDF